MCVERSVHGLRVQRGHWFGDITAKGDNDFHCLPLVDVGNCLSDRQFGSNVRSALLRPGQHCRRPIDRPPRPTETVALQLVNQRHSTSASSDKNHELFYGFPE